MIVSTFAEAKSEEEQRGGALPPLEGLFVVSEWGLAMHEVLKRCSPFSRGEEVRVPLRCPQSPPEPTHEAAVEVWMSLLKWSLNWQFESREVKDAGASARPPFPRRPTAAQEAAIHQLKHCVGDFVRGPIVPCEDWATILKTTRVDYSGAA